MGLGGHEIEVRVAGGRIAGQGLGEKLRVELLRCGAVLLLTRRMVARSGVAQPRMARPLVSQPLVVTHPLNPRLRLALPGMGHRTM